MVELDQMKTELLSYRMPLAEVKDSLDLDNKSKRVEELEMEMEAPGFWDNPDSSNAKMKELKSLKDVAESFDALATQYDDIETLIEMGYEEEDPELIPEIRSELDSFIDTLETMRIGTLLSGEFDKCNAILKLNAGAGGTESCDWASMLYRMYTRWAEKKGYSVEVLDYLDGDEAGIKSVTFQVNGENAYGYLKSEKGVHRLVRISPFNAQGKRQTSFVSLDVMPDIEADLDIEIMMMTSVSIRTEAVAQAVSISTRPHRLSVLPTFRRELWFSVRTSAASIRTVTRRCRCYVPNSI